MAYLLDANVFIQAKNLHYGLDFCPAFWDWLERQHNAGTVLSIEKVRDELIGAQDQLATWAQARAASFFAPADAATIPALAQTTNWVMGAGYEPAAVATFLQGADYYLVAQALARGDTVVTHEVVADSVKKVKIPNACLALGIPYVNTFAMLRAESARFVLP